jgi:uncharacterized protein YodC (DUF2158 family)
LKFVRRLYGVRQPFTIAVEAGPPARANVRLKAGGPLMTVKWVDHEETFCEWFEGKKISGHKFIVTSLEISDDDPVV